MVWLALLGNVWVRRALAVVAVAGLLLMVREHYVRLGERAGVAREAAQTAEEGERQRAEERKTVVAELAAMRAEIAAIDARGAEAARSVAASQAAAHELAGAQQQAAAVVAAIPAGELHEANRRALGEREGAYSPEDERKIAACLAERPLCEQRAGELEREAAGLEQQVADAVKARAVEEEQYQKLSGYTGELEKGYVQLYNAVPRGRKWWLTVVTLGWRGKAPRLAVPSVGELRGQTSR